MSQILKTKKFGEISVERSWVNGLDHVAKLTGGGYAYISGHPIKDRSILKTCIPHGPELNAALEWWDNRDKVLVDKVEKRIVINPDGGYAFDDGSEVENASDLIRHITDKDALNVAIRWFAKELERREKIGASAGSKVAAIAKTIKQAGKNVSQEVEIKN